MPGRTEGDAIEEPALWTSVDMAGTFTELEHPADLFLEIRGGDVERLFENSLYALYSQIADLRAVPEQRSLALEVRGPSVQEALRTLLAEALYRFDVEGFVATRARVRVMGRRGQIEAARAADEVSVAAQLWGGDARPSGALLAEVKAVTYHRLAVSQRPDGEWRATVLFDV